ncbi:MAG: phosphate propanoyltransferase [Patescibacteria group bacterium]
MSKIIIETSGRHAHFTQNDLEKLFGEGYQLKKEKDLSQPGQYAAVEKVTIVGPKRSLEKVRVMGPCRNFTQIEVSKSDCFFLGVKAPVRLSGKVIRSGAIKVIGSKGELELTEGLIVAKRHIHLDPESAHKLKVINAQTVRVKVEGPRALIFDEVEVRVDENFLPAIHLDTDEANSAGMESETIGEIILK